VRVEIKAGEGRDQGWRGERSGLEGIDIRAGEGKYHREFRTREERDPSLGGMISGLMIGEIRTGNGKDGERRDQVW